VPVRDLVERWPVAHASVAVVVDQGPVEVVGDPDRPFPLASVTKLLVAYATLVAIEERTLDLDEPCGPPGSTVRHLLAHASGLGPAEPRPIAPPGRTRIYSNAGFEVLGAHLAARADMPVATYLAEGVLAPLGMVATRLDGSPAHGALSTARDLATFARELFSPRLVSPSMRAQAVTVQFPGLSGVLPGFGRQPANDWGLGFELRSTKHPHWTGTANSTATFGHFGRSGTFLWVDPVAAVACVCLTDEEFGPWAVDAWPRLSDAVLASYGSGR
jgi:CubicO group peptidase (beta-lactamase class C family)